MKVGSSGGTKGRVGVGASSNAALLMKVGVAVGVGSCATAGSRALSKNNTPRTIRRTIARRAELHEFKRCWARLRGIRKIGVEKGKMRNRLRPRMKRALTGHFSIKPRDRRYGATKPARHCKVKMQRVCPISVGCILAPAKLPSELGLFRRFAPAVALRRPVNRRDFGRRRPSTGRRPEAPDLSRLVTATAPNSFWTRLFAIT